MAKAHHTSESCQWFTPLDIIERARDVLGGTIDLDPCTQEGPALDAVRPRFYMDGYGQLLPWDLVPSGRTAVLVNPPSGLVPDFWEHTVLQAAEAKIAAIWIGFSVQQLQTLQNQLDRAFPHPLCYQTCIPRKRLSYTRSDGYSGAPPHASYITNVGANPLRFARSFGEIGEIVQTTRGGNLG